MFYNTLINLRDGFIKSLSTMNKHPLIVLLTFCFMAIGSKLVTRNNPKISSQQYHCGLNRFLFIVHQILFRCKKQKNVAEHLRNVSWIE